MRKKKLTFDRFPDANQLCRQDVLFKDIHNKMAARNRTILKKYDLALRVVNMYFHLKMMSVLEGNTVTFVNGMTIQIIKEKQLRPVRWKNARFCGKADQKFTYSPSRIGFQYKFLIQWDQLEGNHMYLRIAPMYRKMLHQILTQTDKDYPIYEHSAASIN